ncbi:hypothetical protein UFOVP1290_631 [uncultured Caudovirales phage]|uniref:Uncharacterized protein n=1 Tax=uncultured Caudovirales phage TaxID=2100421 RepID=A0A6J5RU80_9CAUD|nr:hypothetical protein UFOVP1290_631 [uncultured Caudovirales phage]
MVKSSRQISFYVDALIVESILKDDRLIKQASMEDMLMASISKIKEYVGEHTNKDDKAGSILNMLAPGFVSMTLSAIGLPKIGLLSGFLMSFFNIDVNAILSSIISSLKGELSGGKQVSSQQVDSIVQSAVGQHSPPATQEEFDNANKIESFSSMMIDVRIFKLSMIQFENGKIRKNAGFLDFKSRKSTSANILTTILGFIFKVFLASGFLMLAADGFNHFVGRPNAFDKTLKTQTPQSAQPYMPKTTQTLFKKNPSYNLENHTSAWSENYSNNESSIGDMLVDFAKDVYAGLEGKENIIKQTAGYRTVLDRILFFNRNTPNSTLIFIPREFSSKKQMVDIFIDEVAAKSV